MQSKDLFDWREFLLTQLVKQKMIEASVNYWSPLEYIFSLDATTRLAVIFALLLTAYLIFSSVLRVSRLVFSLLFFALQLLLVFVVVLVVLQFRSAFPTDLQHLLDKLEL